jgi:hypothetical protein
MTMTRPIIYIAAVIAVLAAATTVLRSHPHSPELPGDALASMPLQELHAAAARGKLLAEDFEDRSLIYPARPTK